MNTFQFHFFGLLFVFFFTQGLSNTPIFEHDSTLVEPDGTLVHYVHALNGLKMRTAPDSRARVITVLEYGESVNPLALDTTSAPFQVGYVTGNWHKVRVGSLEGYVFDGFLSTLPIPGIYNHADYFSQSLRGYALNHFTVYRSDTSHRNEEFGQGYLRKISSKLSHGIHLIEYSDYHSSTVKLEIPNIEIMKAWQLVNALLLIQGEERISKNLIFKKDYNDRIYEISDRFKEDVIIKQIENGPVSIEFKTWSGC